MAIVSANRTSLGSARRGLRRLGGHSSRLGADGPWKRYEEIVTKRYRNGHYEIALRESGAGSGIRPLGAISAQGAGLLSTAGAVGATIGVSSLAAGTALGSFAGPIGAGVGALVGIIAGLFEASTARAKGATEENQAINEYLPAWDSGMQAIFAAANNGTATPAECTSAVQQLMSSWWQAAAQFKGLPGVADASNGGSNCGTYTPGVTTACSPTGGPGCGKSCTAFCCVGCNDLMPSAQYAIYLFQKPGGGSLNVCTVYSSKYGAKQRSSYTLTYTPPKAPAAAPGTAPSPGTTSATDTVNAALASLTGASATTPEILGLPWYVLVGGGALAFLALR